MEGTAAFCFRYDHEALLMTGKDLYQLYVRFNEELINCSVDSWDELLDEDKNVWDAMAGEIPPMAEEG